MKLCTVFRTLLTGCVAFYSTCTPAADTPEPADLIIYNARIITVSPDFTEAQAVAIRGDQIVAVGKEEQLTAYKGINTQLIDAQQRTIMPGLYDNHVHSYNAAVSELNNPVPALDSIVAAQEYIRKAGCKETSGILDHPGRTVPLAPEGRTTPHQGGTGRGHDKQSGLLEFWVPWPWLIPRPCKFPKSPMAFQIPRRRSREGAAAFEAHRSCSVTRRAC